MVVLSGCSGGAAFPEPDLPHPVMKAISASDYIDEAGALPRELVDAISRDLNLTASGYLANAAAAVMAGPVIAYLEENGVDSRDIYLYGTELRVMSEVDELLIQSVGATVSSARSVPSTGEGIQAASSVGFLQVSDESADFRGGLPYGALVDSTFSQICTVGVNGYRQVDGLSEFITSGDCVYSNPGPYSVVDVATAGGAVGTQAEPLGAAVSGTGLSEPDGIALIEAGASAVARPQVATWGGGVGAPGAGTPVEVRDAIAPVVGAPLCKSAPQSGWTCGSIVQIGSGQADIGTVDFETFTASVCTMPGEMGAPGMVGQAFAGIVSTSTWSDTCNSSDQLAPNLYTSFISYKSSGGRPGIASTVGAIWEPMISVATPAITQVERVGRYWRVYGNIPSGSSNYKIKVVIEPPGMPPIPPVWYEVDSDGSFRFKSGILIYGSPFEITAEWGSWSKSTPVTGSFS